MKEMRLFEVGFKENQDRSGYEEKVNVAATDADEAATKARQWLVDKTNSWWEGGGREDMMIMAYTEDKDNPSEMSDEEIMSSKKYQGLAQKDFDNELERVKKMHLAKLYDIGTLIV